MKRSEINAALKEMEQMIRDYRFALPPFCSFTPEDWQSKGHDYDEIRDNMLGWDITDYGMGDFDKMGFSLITIRNGNLKMEKYTKSYAEKLLYLKEGQYSPMHFHWSKMEDIINRGGGNVLIRVYNSTEDEDLDRESDVHVHVDGYNVLDMKMIIAMLVLLAGCLGSSRIFMQRHTFMQVLAGFANGLVVVYLTCTLFS